MTEQADTHKRQQSQNLAARKSLMALVPWVTLVSTDEAARCAAIKWDKIPSPVRKAGGPFAAYRCLRMGHWRFEALPETGDPMQDVGKGTSGLYCWAHLLVEMEELAESERLREWQKTRDAIPENER